MMRQNVIKTSEQGQRAENEMQIQEQKRNCVKTKDPNENSILFFFDLKMSDGKTIEKQKNSKDKTNGNEMSRSTFGENFLEFLTKTFANTKFRANYEGMHS